jgi:hypothetical protein
MLLSFVFLSYSNFPSINGLIGTWPFLILSLLTVVTSIQNNDFRSSTVVSSSEKVTAAVEQTF